jgi:hypothetical protein
LHILPCFHSTLSAAPASVWFAQRLVPPTLRVGLGEPVSGFAVVVAFIIARLRFTSVPERAGNCAGHRRDSDRRAGVALPAVADLWPTRKGDRDSRPSRLSRKANPNLSNEARNTKAAIAAVLVEHEER